MARAKMNEEKRNLFLARALYDAVEDCNVQQVNSLLSQNKASPNILIPEEGMTPFHLAAGHDNMAFGKVVTSLFLHNDGDPNVRCEGNRTVLHISVAWNRSSVVEVLLKSPYIVPDPYLKDDDGLTVFNYAVKYRAWESLATLQLYIKQNKNTCNSKKVLSLKKSESYEQDNSIENNAPKGVIDDEAIGIKSECNKSNNIHTNGGYFNSSESLNCDSVGQINNSDNEFSYTTNSISNILNNNISTDPGDLSAHVHFDESKLSSIHLLNDDFEDLETISFPSEHLLADTELVDNKVELTTKSTSSQTENDLCTMYSEWMTDISGLSSCAGSDYFTCPDGNSSYMLNGKMNKTDKQYGNKVLEKRNGPLSDSVSELPKKLNVLEISEEYLNSSEESSLSDIEDYDTDYVRQSLRKYGHPPGPLVPSTKQLYVRKLNRIIKDESELKNSKESTKNLTGSLYSCQLNKTLFENAFDVWKETLKSWSYLEKDIICYNSGSSFTYLLLDPRITKNLPARAEHITNPVEIWQTFINSIFYIGKGTKSRPNDHMTEAFNSWIGTNTKNLSPKTKYILNLWKENKGVVCVQAFHHLTMNEAHIREAAMIDAIGLDRLTNEKRGTYYDKTLRWRYSDRCKLGCYLLSLAMNVFLADGERQLQPVHLT